VLKIAQSFLAQSNFASTYIFSFFSYLWQEFSFRYNICILEQFLAEQSGRTVQPKNILAQKSTYIEDKARIEARSPYYAKVAEFCIIFCENFNRLFKGKLTVQKIKVSQRY
jgi:hypothetical protein